MKRYATLLSLFACLLLARPAIPQTAQQVIIAGQLAFGLGWSATTVLMNYQEPSTTTCTLQASSVVKIPKNTTNNTINLATLFPAVTTAVAYSIADITSSPGQQVAVGMASSGSRFQMAPMGMMMFRVNGSSPTLYCDNASMTTDAYLSVSCMGN